MKAAAVLLVAAALAGGAPAAADGGVTKPRVLVFTKTAGFRHDSIPVALAAVRRLGARNGFAVDATEDAGAFTDTRLRGYRAVVFLLTTGDVLNRAQQEALRRYVERGGGFAGVHSAADTEHGWPWYARLVGARFASHPEVQRATVVVMTGAHPSTARLPARWTRTDEWYNFDRDPGGSVDVLARLDESSYAPGEGAMGASHPVAWSHAVGRGRAWYTALGHTDASYAEPLFLGHLLGGIRWAARTAR
jgi:type 1 glutamine amidotransferase